MRFLASKHHLCTPVPLRSAITAWQITLQLRPPPRQSTRWMQPSQCSPEFNFTRENAFERKRVKAGPVAQTRFPTTTPGATLREKTQGFVRFLTSKHHLYSRSAAICHHCLANHTTTASASRPPLSSHPYTFPHPYSLHLSNLENPRFTERTSTNLGRSHRLPHVCTIMIYGKLGG